MTEINPELFKHILVYHLLYFIVGGIIFFLAGAYEYKRISKNLENYFYKEISKSFNVENKNIEGLNNKKSVFWCSFLLFLSIFFLSFVGGIVTTADSMARYLQASNKNLLGVSRIAMHHFIAELDTEAFVLLSKEFQKYEKEQRNIKSMETLEYIGKAERIEKQIKKEIQKSLESK